MYHYAVYILYFTINLFQIPGFEIDRKRWLSIQQVPQTQESDVHSKPKVMSILNRILDEIHVHSTEYLK